MENKVVKVHKTDTKAKYIFKITVIGIIGLGGVISAYGFYLYSTMQVNIHRLRFPDK